MEHFRTIGGVTRGEAFDAQIAAGRPSRRRGPLLHGFGFLLDFQVRLDAFEAFPLHFDVVEYSDPPSIFSISMVPGLSLGLETYKIMWLKAAERLSVNVHDEE